MSTYPPNVGPPSSADSIVRLLCVYTGLTDDGPICGQRATTHLRKVSADGELYGAMACDPHADIARAVGFDAEHPTGEGTACDVPASCWIDGPPSRCVIDDSGIERPAASTTTCCKDIAMHSHDGGKTLRMAGKPYAFRWTKTWRMPRFNTYIAATRHPFAIHRHRYGHDSDQPVTIGIALQVGRRVWGAVWAEAHPHGYHPPT